MQKRYFPPTRRSIREEGDVKPSGPHQRIKCLGSVHAFQTASRGASNTRLITSSSLAGNLAEPLCLAAIFPLLSLRFAPAVLQETEVPARGTGACVTEDVATAPVDRS